jgi:hypothetical protein
VSFYSLLATYQIIHHCGPDHCADEPEALVPDEERVEVVHALAQRGDIWAAEQREVLVPEQTPDDRTAVAPPSAVLLAALSLPERVASVHVSHHFLAQQDAPPVQVLHWDAARNWLIALHRCSRVLDWRVPQRPLRVLAPHVQQRHPHL